MLTPLLDPISVVALRSTVSIILGVLAEGITCGIFNVSYDPRYLGHLPLCYRLRRIWHRAIGLQVC